MYTFTLVNQENKKDYRLLNPGLSNNHSSDIRVLCLMKIGQIVNDFAIVNSSNINLSEECFG